MTGASGICSEAPLPVGGETSHAVLTAHSGLAGQRLFSDLDKLECGDTFYVHTLDETMAYMVLEINTVLPEDTSKLVILPEHDVCTLVTCTPYGVNTHRLMVRGTRIRNDQAEYVENLKAERNEREGVTQSTWRQEYFKGIGLGVICIVAIGIVYEINRIRPRRRKRGLHERAKIILLIFMALLAAVGLFVTFKPLMGRASRQKQVDEANDSFIQQLEQIQSVKDAEPEATPYARSASR